MRILIGGEDQIAVRLAEQLMADHNVVLICPEHLKGSQIDRLDVSVIFGSLTSGDVLRQAEMERADVFVACSKSDERNLVACVAAKRNGVKRTTCFLFRRSYQGNKDETSELAESLGIDTVVRPPERLAEEILQIVTVPGALDVQVFFNGRVRLIQHAIEENALISKAPLREVGLPKGIVLVAVRRDGEVFIPTGDTHLRPGDQVIAMGNFSGISRMLFRYLRPRLKRSDPRRATVVGGGLVGLSVALGLEDLGWEVKVVENDKARCNEIAPLMKKSLVLYGDGSDLVLLQEERVADDSVLIAVTSNDEKNLLVSLLAKSMGVRRTVTRAVSIVNERLFEKAGIDVVRSASGAAIRSVVSGLEDTTSELVAELEHGEAAVFELLVPMDFPNCQLREMKQPGSSIIGAILRGHRVIIPHGKDLIQGGDHILVFCKAEDEDEVRHYFERYSGPDLT